MSEAGARIGASGSLERESKLESQLFHPPALLRWLVAALGGVSFLVAASQLLHAGDLRRLSAAVILCIPAVLAVVIWRRSVMIEADGILSRTILGSRMILWSAVRRIDRTRRSFVVETTAGPVSAGWLAAGDREVLMRLIIEKAKLTASTDEPRYGIQATYVPRAQNIGFVPIARRREQKQDSE